MKGFKLQLAVRNFWKYLPLLKNLIARELKTKYRQSYLGYLWCVLNPLLVMLILHFVFSNMFKNQIENFPVYLFSGRMIFSFITDSTKGAMKSVVNNASLMKKTRVPSYIFTLAGICGQMVNLLFTFIAFLLVLLFTRTPLTMHVLFTPVLLVQTMLFCLGLGCLLAVANVFVRDTDYLYAVFVTAWTYLTPLFYPLQALPQWLQTGIRYGNPAYYYIQQCRMIFLDHLWPTPDLLLLGFGVGGVFALAGVWAFYKAKDQFILYL